jgi:hypothetical protein
MTPVDDAAADAVCRVAVRNTIDNIIQAASDFATRDPTYAATCATTRHASLPHDAAIYRAIDAAIRAGGGSLRSK